MDTCPPPAGMNQSGGNRCKFSGAWSKSTMLREFHSKLNHMFLVNPINYIVENVRKHQKSDGWNGLGDSGVPLKFRFAESMTLRRK